MEWSDLVFTRGMDGAAIPTQRRGCDGRAAAQLVRYSCEYRGSDVRTVHTTDTAGEKRGWNCRCSGGGDTDGWTVLGMGRAAIRT